MYPSKRYKHYGSFVKNVKGVLEDNGYIVDKSVMYKQDHIVGKILSYLSLYIGTILKGMFTDYDYIYAHYISHSGWPCVFLKKTSKNIFLVLNAHGNDVLADMDFEKKNANPIVYEIKVPEWRIDVPKYKFYPTLKKNYTGCVYT